MGLRSRTAATAACWSIYASVALAQLSNVPTLGPTSSTTSSSSTSTAQTTAQTTAATTSSGSATVTFSSATSSIFSLSGAPSISGVGIPTMVIPYTANAPFMQKSNLPEGTVFIAVGGVLALVGACILLWRLMVAWSINRSVKRAAIASVRGSEKTSTHWGGSAYGPAKGTVYQTVGSSVSLSDLTSAGRPIKPHFKDSVVERTTTPQSDLFFSPTAHSNRESVLSHRGSSYFPAGYYASPSAQVAGGQGATTVGGSLAPYARNSTANLSPPSTPGKPPGTSGSSTTYRRESREGLRASSRDGLRAPSRDGLAGSNRNNAYRRESREGLRASSRDGLRAPSRDGFTSSNRNSYRDSRQNRGSGIYTQPSTSSLMVGLGGANDGGHTLNRAPSAYLDDLFENHGNGPRERY